MSRADFFASSRSPNGMRLNLCNTCNERVDRTVWVWGNERDWPDDVWMCRACLVRALEVLDAAEASDT